MSKWHLFFLLLCQCVGLAVFIKGFLLTRTVIPDRSPGCIAEKPLKERSWCISQDKLRFKRVVWILIDALRHDFAVYNESLDPEPPPFRNRMRHVHRYLTQKPRHTRLYHFTADPPTTTMQRLKALTTGSLPTFVDIGSNFNSYEVEEDNLISQCKKNGGRVTFIGDDTWLGLYPSLLDKTFPYSSLNVKDLHTVDLGVIEHLIPELSKRDANFIIGHLLGVDHCGHTYGPSHLYMSQKLAQMDDFLKDVFKSVPDDTIVFVFGDHGMTMTGDHGGETSLETDSALLVYSPRPLFEPRTDQSYQVFQTDIVPTVSLLLGIPIPFSSLGMVIPDLFLTVGEENKETKRPQKKPPIVSQNFPNGLTTDFLDILFANMEQLYNYLKTLLRHNSNFSPSIVDSLTRRYRSARRKFQDFKAASGSSSSSSDSNSAKQQADMISTAEEMMAFIRAVRSACIGKWAKFDDFYIYFGIILLFAHLVSVCLLLFGNGRGLLKREWLRSFRHKSFFKSFITRFASSEGFDWIAFLCLVLVVLHAFSLFSNSFIVFEQHVVSFLSQTLILVLALKKVRQFLSAQTNSSDTHHGRTPFSHKRIAELFSKALPPYIGVMICIRLSSIFHSCRDQQDECAIPEFLKPLRQCEFTTLLQGAFRCGSLGMSLYLFVFILGYTKRVFTNYLSNHEKKYSQMFLSCYSYVFTHLLAYGVVLILMFEFVKPVSMAIIWLFYVVSIAGVIIIIWNPFLFSSSYLKEIESARFQSEASPTHDSTTAIDDMVHFLSPIFWLFLLALIPIVLVTVIPNDSYIFVFGLMLLQLALTVTILQESPKVSLGIRAVVCSLFVDQYFFALGHQAIVNSLKIEAGFVGLHGDMASIILVLAGVLVGINVLASQILGSIFLPLMLPYKLSSYKASSNPVLASLLRIQLLYMGVGSLKLFCAAVCASVLRRHLMLWAVFGPRFVYEAAFQCLTGMMSLLMYMFVQRSQSAFARNIQEVSQKSF